MVASDNEVNVIMRILRQYWPETSIEMMLQEVWDTVGKHTDNESLKESIRLMLKDVSVGFMVKDK